MMTWAGVFAIVLGMLVIFVEATRRKADQIDFLLPVSWLMLLCFVAVPILLPVYQNDDLGTWNWLFEKNVGEWASSISVLLATLVYALVVWVYLRVPKTLGTTLARRTGRISAARLAIVATAFLVASLLAIAVFVWQRGGLLLAVSEAAVFKASEEPLGDLLFAIKLSPFSFIASLCFWHLFLGSRGFALRFPYACLLIVSMLTAILSLFLLGGRVSFIFFILTFVLGELIYQRQRIGVGGVVVLLMLVVPIVLFGKATLRGFMEEGVVGSTLDTYLDSPNEVFKLFVLEFSFPWRNVVNFLALTPDPISFRWFVDVPIAVVSLLPKLLLGIHVPASINEVYDRVLDAPVPIDLTSFGYVSAGVGGVGIVAVAFGLLLRIAETIFSGRESRLWCLFRGAWILVLGQQVMYGSPYHFITGSFTLIVGTALLLIISSERTGSEPRG